MTIEEVLTYCREQYGTEPEYPWNDLPAAGVLRHRDNPKWYGVFMSVTADKLGRPTQERITILDIKGDPDDIVHIREMPGFAPAYHMNKKHWLTVILPEITDPAVVWVLIDKSYRMTGSMKKRKEHTNGIEK